ncbi:MAG TPA: NAD(P)/FAD-dependent oxidoreductase [Thermoanaerobaculia bacterium]|nr:NAD(P)/FAD-dependent oxidoreductase [Thermoanaerobaculia bacterium]
MTTQQVDMVVIGGGNAGLSAAYRVARAGKRVVLVDKGPVGGLCSLAGCNPKKVFVRASEVLETVRESGKHGVNVGKISVDWETVWKRKHAFTDPVPEWTEKSLADAGVQRVRAVARFLDQQTIAAGDDQWQAEGFVIATGSHPRRLQIPGAELLKTSNDVLELRKPPARMVVIGSGVVAFEFSHVFARLGTKVTMLMRGRGGLTGFDDNFAELALEFTREHLGVEFMPMTDLTAIHKDGNAYRVECACNGREVVREADFVLNAAGRDAAVEDLNLAAANVETSQRGVVVDNFLRSKTNRRVFAGGDAHGIRQLSPVASYEGRVIAQNFLQGDVRQVDYTTVPQSIFTTPPLASVGLTETIAREMGRDITVHTADMSQWTVYAIAGEPIARAQVVAEKKTRKVLGAQLFGAAASENIHLFALAIQCGLTIDHLAEMVYAYPTFASTIQSLFA